MISTIDRQILNNQYAPGIATYGIDGKTGNKGDSGTSIYFSAYSLSDDDENTAALVKITQGKTLSQLDSDVSIGDRSYGAGDLFVDSEGKIYRLYVNTSGGYSLELMTSIPGIMDSSYFSHEGKRTYLDTSADGLDIIKSSDASSYTEDTDYAIRIVNSQSGSTTGDYSLMTLHARTAIGSEKYLNFVYDGNATAFRIDSNAKVFIDTSVLTVNGSDNSDSVYSNYRKIVPYSDPVGLLHRIYSSATYSVNGTAMTVTFPAVTQSGIDIFPDMLKIKIINGINSVCGEYIIPLSASDRILSGSNYSFTLSLDSIPDFTVVSDEYMFVYLVKGIEININRA